MPVDILGTGKNDAANVAARQAVAAAAAAPVVPKPYVGPTGGDLGIPLVTATNNYDQAPPEEKVRMLIESMGLGELGLPKLAMSNNITSPPEPEDPNSAESKDYAPDAKAKFGNDFKGYTDKGYGGYMGLRPQFGSNVLAMFKAMEKAGVGRPGVNSAFRSHAEQKAIYYDPNRTAPAAKPGTSNHERGIAVDLQLSASQFNWMKKHASKYGLYNFPAERWHWSANGR